MNPIFLCSVCSGPVTEHDGVLHAVELTSLQPDNFQDLEFFAFYRWNREAATSGDFQFCHKREQCIGEQIDRYLTRFSWGTVQGLSGSRVVGMRNRCETPSVIEECERLADRALAAAKR